MVGVWMPTIARLADALIPVEPAKRYVAISHKLPGCCMRAVKTAFADSEICMSRQDMHGTA
jgi:hypothetical protein